jgi:hypothetical protein
MKYLFCTGVYLQFFVSILCNFYCLKPFAQLGKDIINAILKPVAFDVVSNDTAVISKEISTVCFQFYIFQSVHLRIILVSDQLDAQLLL